MRNFRMDQAHEYSVGVAERRHRSERRHLQLRAGQFEAVERVWNTWETGVDQDAEATAGTSGEELGQAFFTANERRAGMTSGEDADDGEVQQCRGFRKDGKPCRHQQKAPYCPKHATIKGGALADFIPDQQLPDEAEDPEQTEWRSLMAQAKSATNGDRAEAVGHLLDFLRRQTARMAVYLEAEDVTPIGNGQATQHQISPEAIGLRGLDAEAYEAIQCGGEAVRQAWQKLFAVIAEAEPAAKATLAAHMVNGTAPFPVGIQSQSVIGPIVVGELKLVAGQR